MRRTRKDVAGCSSSSMLVLLPGGSTGGTLSTGRSVTAHSASLFLSSVVGSDQPGLGTRPTFLASVTAAINAETAPLPTRRRHDAQH